MQILDIIASAQGGHLITHLAAAAGVDQETARSALDRLVPEIARRIAEKADDPDERAYLLDVVDDSEADDYLDNPRTLLSRSATKDGEDILAYLYGSLAAARREAARIGAPPGMEEPTFEALMTFAAVLVLAAMTRRNKRLAMPAATPGSGAGGGIAAALVSAVVKGFVDGMKRALVPRRRRTRISTRRSSRTRRKRSSSKPGLNDILGDLVKDALKPKSGR